MSQRGVPEAMADWAIIRTDQTSGLLGHVPGAHSVPGDRGLDDDPGLEEEGGKSGEDTRSSAVHPHPNHGATYVPTQTDTASQGAQQPENHRLEKALASPIMPLFAHQSTHLCVPSH